MEDAIVEDPRGISILIRAKRWRRHVLKRHGDMQHRYGEVVATLEHPDFITQSADARNANLYYRWARVGGSGPHPRLPLLAVVVRLDYDASEGLLVTAYPEREIPEGERIIWTP